MVRPGLQHQRGGGGHRSGSLPPLRGLRGSVRRPEAPPGAPLLRILQQRPSSEAFAGCWGAAGLMTLRFLSLFQYMVILFMVFVLQFSISCACLALNTEQQNQLLEVGWNKSENTQKDVEKTLNCCGFSSVNLNQTCPARCVSDSSCSSCASILQTYAGDVLHFVGGVGLFFSFTEILGVWLTHRYRNLKDPRTNPGAFL
uniref:Tetraspanin 13a n=1 Tax=Oryzias sinensis TaxID=183150 RepID=A0A8C7YFL8_9TELE